MSKKNEPLNNYNTALLEELGKWKERSYSVDMKASEYQKAREQMKKQDESKDDIILLKLDYTPLQQKCKITDKVRIK
jgi:hypothetical protein